MEIGEELQDKIDRYILRQMSAEERQAFDAAIQQDKELQQEVKLQQNMVGLLEDLGDHRLKMQLNKVYEAVITNDTLQTEPVTKSWKYWAVAASVVVMLGLAFFFVQKRNTSEASLFAQYYQPERYIATRDLESDPNSAGAYFNKGMYAQALKHFQAASQVTLGSSYDRLFEGLCYLQLEQYTQAEERFVQVIRESTLLKTKAQWYLALVYLKTNKVDTCQTILKELANSPSAGPYQQSARKLLADLE
jgi:tetratricopeptide (TPR) repeat protein